MARRTSRGRQTIEMKLIESKAARYVSFSKRKASLFRKANELAALTGADVGVLLFSPSGKPHSFGSSSIEEITERFLNWKLDDYPGVASDVFQSFEELCQELEAANDKEERRKRRYQSIHSCSEVPPDKQRLEHLVQIKLWLDKVKGKTKREIQELKASTPGTRPSTSAKPCRMFDLNVAAEPDEGETSGTH